ncbi:MAG TPA: SCO family protein [Pyrinomonadaceae bacterium]|nr:SCO family protein [Pyrinomonadaceae bacterium]
MKKAVVSGQWSMVSQRKAEGGSVPAGGRIFFVCLLLVASCSLSLAQGRLYNGTSPLYSPRPDLGVTENGLPVALRDVTIEQRLNEQVPLDLRFKDDTGREVTLREYFNKGKPVVLSLVFYKCPMICDTILTELMGSLRAMSFDAGREFDVLTVSFDPRETPEMAAEKKRNFIQRYNRPGAEKGWHFLVGDQENIRRLTEAVGFHYNYDEKTDQFAHAAGIMVITPEGRLSRYFIGTQYYPKDLRLSLVEASDNKIGSLVDQLLLYCYHYDPATGRYGPAILNIMRLGGVVTVVGIVSLILVLRRRNGKARSGGAAAAAGARPSVGGTA